MITNFYSELFGRFSHINKDTPYKNEQAYIDDLMTLVSGYLHLAITIRANTTPEDNLFLDGLPFDPEFTIAYLKNYNKKPFPSSDDIINCLISAEESINNKLEITPCSHYRFIMLKNKLHLNDFSYFTLFFSYGCAVDRAFESAFAMLHDDDKISYPTLETMVNIYSLTKSPPSVYDYDFCASGTLSSLIYTGVKTSPQDKLTHLQLSDHTLYYLSGRDYPVDNINYSLIDGSLSDQLLFCNYQYNYLSKALENQSSWHMGAIIDLSGCAGSGRKLTLHNLAEAYNRPFLLIPDFSLESTNIPQLILYSILEEYNLCFDNVNTDNSDQVIRIEQLLHILEPYCPIAILLTDDSRYSFNLSGYSYRKLEYPLPNHRDSVDLWKYFSINHKISPEIDWQVITSKYKLTPGQIKKALIQSELEDDQQIVTLENLTAAIIQNNNSRLSEMADLIQSFYTIEDLILSQSTKRQLLDVSNRIKYKYTVEEQWGFKKKSAYGNGVSILFYGPPGTGKTMSAQVLSGELGLPLYRINISQITSKYIGETTKNLNKIFEEANKTNAILFFDEADALFTKRTEVSNSNDRHANSEVSYLLQKIEEFSGVSILATNLANNFDDAFRRRINYMINIHLPSPEQRVNLWKNSFPPSAPLDEDINFDMLSEGLEFSGSVIKSAATQSAYFAAAEGKKISMAHIARAVQAELLKLGKPLPHFLHLYLD